MSQIPGAVSGADIGTILSALERGTVMVRFPARKRRPEKKLFCLKVDTFEVVQYPLSKGTRTVAEESSTLFSTSSDTRAYIVLLSPS